MTDKETANQELIRRIKAVQEEHNCGLITAKNFVLRNDARLAGDFALHELTQLLGSAVAQHLDDLIKARITEAGGA